MENGRRSNRIAACAGAAVRRPRPGCGAAPSNAIKPIRRLTHLGTSHELVCSPHDAVGDVADALSWPSSSRKSTPSSSTSPCTRSAHIFDAGIGALQWVIDSYNLAYAVLLLSGGLLADLYGRRRIFMVGAAVFTLASMLCALAPSVAILIAGRALAGLGGALLIPASLAIVRVVWQDPGERARALGIWGACNGLAMTVGPTAGGLLIHAFGWRSVS